MRWTLGEPCTRLTVGHKALLLVKLHDVAVRVIDADMLSGIHW